MIWVLSSFGDCAHRVGKVDFELEGHVDRKVISQTLPQALEYVWQGYAVQASRPHVDRARR